MAAKFIPTILVFIVLDSAGKVVQQSTGDEINPHGLPEDQTAYRVTFGGYENKPGAVWLGRGWSNRDGSKSGYKGASFLPTEHVATVTEVMRRVATAGAAKVAAAA